MKKTNEKETKKAEPKVTPKNKDVDTGKTQGSETEKLAVEPTIEDEHPATHNKHVVVPDTEDNEITPPETLKTDVQNESTKPAIATNIPKFENTEQEVLSEKGEHLDKNYGNKAAENADEINTEVETSAVFKPTVLTEEQVESEDDAMKSKIINFIKGNKGGEQVKLNDFLKSLYGVPNNNEPAEWLQQGSSKRLRSVIQKLVDDGEVVLTNEEYKKLGAFYYEGNDQKQKHHNLNTVEIFAQK